MFDSINSLQKCSRLALLAVAIVTVTMLPLAAAGAEHAGHAAGAKECKQCTKKSEGQPCSQCQLKKGIVGPYLLKSDPVSGELLGESPVIVHVDGKELRFASEESVAKFKEEPEVYLEAIGLKMVELQLPYYPLDTCVISGEKLGSMGEPVDFVYGNQLVRFCCGGCEGEFLKTPAKHLAEIDAAVVAKQKQDYPLATCVVSDGKLGDMGEPVDHVVGNRLVRFCCKGCKKPFNKTPLVYLEKIDKAEGQSGND